MRVNFGPPTTQLLWNSRCVKSCSYPTPTRTVMYSPHCIPIRGTLDTREKESRSYALPARATSGCTRAHPPSASVERDESSALRAAFEDVGRGATPRTARGHAVASMDHGGRCPDPTPVRMRIFSRFVVSARQQHAFLVSRTRQQVLQNYHAPSATRARPRGRITISIRSRETGAP